MRPHGASGEVRGNRRLDEIGKLLATVEGLALVTYGDLSAELVPAGEVDGTDDIPRMARSDNVWSHAVLAAGAALFGYLPTYGIPVAELDFYYDPKDLTAAHRAAVEQAFHDTLPEIAREVPPTPERPTVPTLTVGRVQPVPKRTGKMAAGALQLGTNVAHHLCAQAEALIGGREVPRVLVKDHTRARVNMVSHFLGATPDVFASSTGGADAPEQPGATAAVRSKPGS